MFAVETGLQHGNSGAGWSGWTLCGSVPPPLAAGGTAIRATFMAGADGADLQSVYIGHAGAASSHFDGGQVRLTFGGAFGKVLGPWEVVTSDEIQFALTPAHRLVHRAYFGGASSVARGGAPTFGYYYASGDVSGDAQPVMSQGANGNLWLVSVEALGGSAEAPSGSARESAASVRVYNCLAGVVPAIPTNPNGASIYLNDVSRCDDWCAANFEAGDVVVLGDSMAAYANWNMALPYTASCGIGGEKVAGVLSRINASPVLQDALRQAGGVLVWIGVNDINAGADMAPLKTQMSGLMQWLSGPLVVVGVVFQSTPAQHARTAEFNAHTQAVGAARGSFRYVDLNAYVCGGTGDLLLPQYSRDGLHLSRDGYRKLYPLVRNAFAELWRL